MQRSLHEHILSLETKIQELREQLTDHHRVQLELDSTEAELRVAELALTHYRSAYELEKKLEWSVA